MRPGRASQPLAAAGAVEPGPGRRRRRRAASVGTGSVGSGRPGAGPKTNLYSYHIQIMIKSR